MPLGIPHSTFLSWDEDDQSKALAWTREQRQVCSHCGTRLEEWDESKGGDEYAYVAQATRCPGCEALEDARQQVPEDANRSGVRFHLVPNPGDEG